MNCHALLQGNFPTPGSNPCLLCLLQWQANRLPLPPPGISYPIMSNLPNMTSLDLLTPNHPTLPRRSRTTIIPPNNNFAFIIIHNHLLSAFTLEPLYTPMREPSLPLLFKQIHEAWRGSETWRSRLLGSGPRASTRPKQRPARRLSHRASGSWPQPHSLVFLMSRSTHPPDESTLVSAQGPSWLLGAQVIPSRSMSLQKNS